MSDLSIEIKTEAIKLIWANIGGAVAMGTPDGVKPIERGTTTREIIQAAKLEKFAGHPASEWVKILQEFSPLVEQFLDGKLMNITEAEAKKIRVEYFAHDDTTGKTSRVSRFWEPQHPSLYSLGHKVSLVESGGGPSYCK